MSNWKNGNFLHEITKLIQEFIEEKIPDPCVSHIKMAERLKDYAKKQGYTSYVRTRADKIVVDIIRPIDLDKITITNIYYE